MKVRSIRSKVLIAITGITLLTAAAMAFVFYGRSSRMIEENYITVLSQRTRLLTDTVDDMLKNVCNIDIKASCDKEIKEELDEERFSGYLFTDGLPDPELIIRTSGEERLSGFLLWQCAYSELYFCDTLWPDFGPEDMDRAIVAYQQRDRRFGGVK